MDNVIKANIKSQDRTAFTRSVWQYDYGQILQITGAELPPAVEVQFALAEKSGETITRVATTVDGVTEVQIPNELLKRDGCMGDYFIYAFIFVSNKDSGNTKYEIQITVKKRPKPEEPTEEPEQEENLFHATVVAVNASAERAEMAEQKAKASATEAGKYASSASESAVAAEKTKEDALKEVGEKKQEAIEAIQEQEETSVGKITTHTDDEIQRILNQTAGSKRELEQTITNAGVSKEELDESIQTAGDTKTALDKSVELAGTAKAELDTSTQKAGEAKTALDESARTAGEMQETLSATVKQAGALDTSLGEKIETGTQLKTDLTVSGEKAVQDIQTAGSEQLGKMQAVAEEFTADREQIATNKEDIGSLKEDIGNIGETYKNYFNKEDVIELSPTIDSLKTRVEIGYKEKAFVIWFNFLPSRFDLYDDTDALWGKFTTFKEDNGLYYLEISGKETTNKTLKSFALRWLKTSMENIDNAMVMIDCRIPNIFVPYGKHFIFNEEYVDFPKLPDISYKQQQYSVYFGKESGLVATENPSNDDGKYNAGFGVNALKGNTTGNHNTAFGFSALQNNTIGNNNTACGEDALLNIAEGDSNTAIGVRAMQSSISGKYNTVVGSKAGYNTNGSHNTFMGRNAGDTNTNGTYNIAIGSGAKVGDVGTNRILLGSQAINNEDNTVMLGNTDTEKVFSHGDFDCRKNGGGIILRDDNGNVYKLKVETDGQLSIVQITS